MADTIYYGCPVCNEPKTTLDHGQHVFLNATSVQFGMKCRIALECTVCGFVKEITNEIKQISSSDFSALLVKNHSGKISPKQVDEVVFAFFSKWGITADVMLSLKNGDRRFPGIEEFIEWYLYHKRELKLLVEFIVNNSKTQTGVNWNYIKKEWIKYCEGLGLC